MTKDQIIRDAVGISSGTIATLIGDTRLDRIEQEQAAFVRFVQMDGRTFGTWQEAWGEFVRLNRPPMEARARLYEELHP